MNRLMFAWLTVGFLAAVPVTSWAAPTDAILIDFSSARCMPCKAMKPVLDQLATAGVPIRHVDVNSEPSVAQRFGIRQTPTYIVMSGGKEVTRLVGTQTAAQLQQALATDPSGPLVATGSKSRTFDEIPAPQTRLAPVERTGFGGAGFANQSFGQANARTQQTLTQANAPGPSSFASQDRRSEAMPSMSAASAAERARAATVRLRVHDGNGYGAGTGTIVDTHGEDALVLTCGHLFRDNEGQGKVEVDLFVGGQVKTVMGEVIDYDAENRDIALVAIKPGIAVQPVQILNIESPPRTGQVVFSYGCDRGDDPSRRDTRITGVNKYNQHLGASNIEIEGAPIDGRSGGGLFDEAGRLVGVCNAADYKNDVGIYTGPGSIQWQLDRVNLAHLYRSGSRPGSTDAIADSNVALASATTPNPQNPAAHQNPATQQSPPAQRIAAAPQRSFQPSPASGNAGTQDSDHQEVIVIVRDRRNPEATSRVMTLREPTADLMRMIHSQAR